MPIKVKKPLDYLKDQVRRNFCIYGPPGIGKTTLVAGATKPLILATDPEGPISLLRRPELRGVPFIECETSKDIEDAVKAVTSSREFSVENYQTIIVDTISTDQTIDLIELRRFVKNEAGKASQNEWSLTNQHMSDRLFTLLTKANRSVIVVAHEKRIYQKSQNTENVLIGIEPSVTPGTLETINRLCSNVYYYYKAATKPQEIRRMVTSAGSTKAMTKDRYGLPNIDNPESWQTVEQMINKIREGYSDV